MGNKLEAFKHSRAGQFLQKVMDDRAPNLAVLLAWGTLNTLLPLTLGILAIAGFVLRDPDRLNQLTSAMFSALPSEAAQTLQGILTSTRENAGAAGIVSLLLLLFSGTNFFGNMEMVFDLAYHVEDRNIIMQRVTALIMLLIVTALLLVSTTAYSLGNVVGTLPIGLPVGPVLGRALGWLISIVSALVMFLLLYKILPNKPQGWKQTLPGAVAAAVAFFIILQVFPLYLAIFGKGFQAYAAFGVFLVLMFWLYLLGLILVAGAELNAYLEEPGRSTALAASKAKAEKGQAQVRETGGAVEADATGIGWTGGEETGDTQQDRPGLFGRAAARGQAQQPQQSQQPGRPQPGGRTSTLPGKLIGLAGLTIAALLLRGHAIEEPESTAH
jgi:membrane protein